jgi:hypothetical protein
MPRESERRVRGIAPHGHTYGNRTRETNLYVRQYKHARNAHGGIDSLCLKCRAIIASMNDEWSLLDCEQRHICNR